MDLVGGELVIDGGHSFNLLLGVLLVKGVEVELDVLLAVQGDLGVLASDGGWVHLQENINIRGRVIIINNYNIF